MREIIIGVNIPSNPERHWVGYTKVAADMDMGRERKKKQKHTLTTTTVASAVGSSFTGLTSAILAATLSLVLLLFRRGKRGAYQLRVFIQLTLD